MAGKAVVANMCGDSNTREGLPNNSIRSKAQHADQSTISFTSANGHEIVHTAFDGRAISPDHAYDSSQGDLIVPLLPRQSQGQILRRPKRRKVQLIDETAFAGIGGCRKRAALQPVCDFHASIQYAPMPGDVLNSGEARESIESSFYSGAECAYLHAIEASQAQPFEHGLGQLGSADLILPQRWCSTEDIPDNDLLEAESSLMSHASEMNGTNESNAPGVNSLVPTTATTSRNATLIGDGKLLINQSDNSTGSTSLLEPWEICDFDEDELEYLFQVPPAALPGESTHRQDHDTITAKNMKEEWDLIEIDDEDLLIDLVKRIERPDELLEVPLKPAAVESSYIAESGVDEPDYELGHKQDEDVLLTLEPPAAIMDRSYIDGMTSEPLLRVCFTISDVLQYGCEAARRELSVVVEFYARVRRSVRDGEKQSFVLGDMYHDDPPFLDATCDCWKGIGLFDYDSSIFLAAEGDGMLCRCLGHIIRLGSTWIMSVSSIWQTNWDDIDYIKGIIQMQRSSYATGEPV